MPGRNWRDVTGRRARAGSDAHGESLAFTPTSRRGDVAAAAANPRLAALLRERDALTRRMERLVNGGQETDPREAARFPVASFAQRRAEAESFAERQARQRERALAQRAAQPREPEPLPTAPPRRPGADGSEDLFAPPSAAAPSAAEFLARREETVAAQRAAGRRRGRASRDIETRGPIAGRRPRRTRTARDALARPTRTERTRERVREPEERSRTGPARSTLDRAAAGGRAVAEQAREAGRGLRDLDARLERAGVPEADREAIRRDAGLERLGRTVERTDRVASGVSRAAETPRRLLDGLDGGRSRVRDLARSPMDRVGPYAQARERRLSLDRGGSGDVFERAARARERARARRHEAREQEARDQARRDRAARHRRDRAAEERR
ncbi:MAG: hypothetical protein V2J24_16345 [Pseudomonadales bacterium]|jgi:hypothetical protein|nr:hypothetical protein [Pseudomonadales bacterium]